MYWRGIGHGSRHERMAVSPSADVSAGLGDGRQRAPGIRASAAVQSLPRFSDGSFDGDAGEGGSKPSPEDHSGFTRKRARTLVATVIGMERGGDFRTNAPTLAKALSNAPDA